MLGASTRPHGVLKADPEASYWGGQAYREGSVCQAEWGLPTREPLRGGAWGWGMDPHLCGRPGPSLSGKDGACRISMIISLAGPWWAGGFALASAGGVGACGGAGWSLPLSAAPGARGEK